MTSRILKIFFWAFFWDQLIATFCCFDLILTFPLFFPEVHFTCIYPLSLFRSRLLYLLLHLVMWLFLVSSWPYFEKLRQFSDRCFECHTIYLSPGWLRSQSTKCSCGWFYKKVQRFLQHRRAFCKKKVLHRKMKCIYIQRTKKNQY